MHELAVTQSLLEIALRHAGCRRITDLYVVVGQLSSYVDDAVQFYWDLIAENTHASGARLHFRRIPAELACHECGANYPLSGDDFACPACHSMSVEVLSGDEFYLEAIEVASDDLAREGSTSDAAYSGSGTNLECQ